VGPSGPIVLYDGVCGLCNRYVRFVLERDRRRQFRFASLQGHSAPGRSRATECIWTEIPTRSYCSNRRGSPRTCVCALGCGVAHHDRAGRSVRGDWRPLCAWSHASCATASTIWWRGCGIGSSAGSTVARFLRGRTQPGSSIDRIDSARRAAAPGPIRSSKVTLLPGQALSAQVPLRPARRHVHPALGRPPGP
jgi:hypothetical protein